MGVELEITDRERHCWIADKLEGTRHVNEDSHDDEHEDAEYSASCWVRWLARFLYPLQQTMTEGEDRVRNRSREIFSAQQLVKIDCNIL